MTCVGTSHKSKYLMFFNLPPHARESLHVISALILKTVGTTTGKPWMNTLKSITCNRSASRKKR